MRIGIYNHQHLRGGCPGCSQIYVKGMISDSMQCQNRAVGIFGEGHEYFNYTDLGDYPSGNLERPGFKRMMVDVENGKLDVVMVIQLSKISDDVDLVLDTYERCKKAGVKLLTYQEGLRTVDILDKALENRK